MVHASRDLNFKLTPKCYCNFRLKKK